MEAKQDTLECFAGHSTPIFKQLSCTIDVQGICCIAACEGLLQFCIGRYRIGSSSEALKIFSNCRFPPSSPLKPYPKKPSCGKEVIKFPDWNEPKAGTSQEHMPVKSVTMVRYPVLIFPHISIFGKKN